MNEWSIRKRVVVITAIVAGLVTLLGMVGSKTSSASEPVATTIIHTHSNMSIPDHVFQSKYERCNLPSREELAAQTGTKLKNWGEPYFDNRQIQYNGVSDHDIRIQLSIKDQVLGDLTSTNRFYLSGDTYVGRGPFYFRCFDSRNLKFNPNVQSICHNGKALLKSATDRIWTKGKYQNSHSPSASYDYERRAFLPRFFVPRDSQFVWADNDNWEMTLPGYLTLRVPFRNKLASKDVWIDAFC